MERPYRIIVEDGNFNLDQLISVCDTYLTEVESGNSEDSDTPHYIFEKAMELVYGKEVWKYINAKIK